MPAGFRVLLVEDDDPLRKCLDEVLAAAGYDVSATAFGIEAIQLARTRPFDFSILDFHLPGMNGLEVLKAISAFRPMPSIMMSGLASQEEAALARQAGAFTFLRKPLDLAVLRSTVNQLIQLHFRPRPGQNPGLR
jgi:two-component system response regulator AtoC